MSCFRLSSHNDDKLNMLLFTINRIILTSCFRLGSHSTSDDQEQYQDMKQVEYWHRNLYPATRLKLYLIEKEIWDEEKEEELAKRIDKEIKVCKRLTVV